MRADKSCQLTDTWKSIFLALEYVKLLLKYYQNNIDKCEPLYVVVID